MRNCSIDIQNLEEIRIITKEFIVIKNNKRRKNMRYAFSYNYFRFWFRYVYLNKMLIEKRDDMAFASLKKKYNIYLGVVFEKVVSEFFWETKPFRFTRLGKWWHKDNEIDLVALNEFNNEIFFIECKWAYLKGNRIGKIFNGFKDKSFFLDWNYDAKKYYVIFAKKVDTKEIFRKEGFNIFDLVDIPDCNRTHTQGLI